MNENVGASFGLSVLIVVFFAVVLYQPDPPRSPAKVTATASASASTPVEPVEAHPPEAASLVRPVALREPERANENAKRATRPPSSKPNRRTASVTRTTRGAFTQVREGETLADVAERVYGVRHALPALWSANRDLLDRADSPVTAGSILRTP